MSETLVGDSGANDDKPEEGKRSVLFGGFQEVDLEAGGGGKNGPPKPPALSSLRYYICLLVIISPFVTTYSRTIINFAITDMIDPEMIERKESTSRTEIQANGTYYYFDLDHSCPVSDEVRVRLIEENNVDIRRAHSGPDEKYKWDTVKQGLLKAAFSIGHVPLQIPGSRLAEIYGPRLIMSTSLLLMAVCCLSAPYLATLHFWLIFGDLVLLGVVGSFMTPALITIFANWLTPSEKSFMLSLYLVTSRLGYASSSLFCGLLIQAQYSWRYVFFSAGWISLLYSVALFVCFRSRPQDHPLMKKRELDYMASKNTLVREALEAAKLKTIENNNDKMNIVQSLELNTIDRDNSTEASKNKLPSDKPAFQKQQQKKGKKTGAPWLAILTNTSVWSFIITKFCVKLAGDTIQIELPTYLKKVMHFSAEQNGFVNASNYVLFCLSCLAVSPLAKTVLKRRPFGMSKTTTRKCFQCSASFGVSLALIGIAYSVCNNTLTLAFLMLNFIITTLGTGGETQIPLDVTERYSGTIHAMASSLAISGAIEPTLVGFLLRGHAADRDSWKFVWLGASAISFFGGVVFLIFADATIQPFDSINEPPQTNTNNEMSEGTDNKAFEKDAE